MKWSWMVLLGASCYRGTPPAAPAPTRSGPLVLETPAPTTGTATLATGAGPAPAPETALILRGTSTHRLGARTPASVDRICVQDQARIGVDGTARIKLTSDRTTIIGGAGIGPRGTSPVTIEIVAVGAPAIYVLFDNREAPVRAVFDAPNSQVHVGITGQAGLRLEGRTGAMNTYAGWGLPSAFPTCGASAPPPASSGPARARRL